MYVVRYADDFVMAFQKEQDARAMHRALAQRLADFGLKLHPQKTRVIEFGRFASESRAGRGLAKPRDLRLPRFYSAAMASFNSSADPHERRGEPSWRVSRKNASGGGTTRWASNTPG